MHLLSVFLAIALALTADALPSYSQHNGTWKPLAPIAIEPRQEHGVAAFDEEVYILGGITTYDPTKLALPSLAIAQAYCPREDAWRRIADIPVPINHGNVAGVGGKLYLLGALTGDTVWTNPPINYAYTPKSDAWEQLPDMPLGTARGASAVGVWGDTVLLAGGLTGQSATNASQPTVGFVSAFNTTSSTWFTLPDLPEPRDHVGGAIIDNTFFVVGGRLNSTTEVRDTVFAMDLLAAEKTWVLKKGKVPTARGGLSAAAIGPKIYTFGGEGSITLERPAGVYNNVEVYDTQTDTWEVLPPMAFPRHGTGAAAIDGRIHIPGGANFTVVGAVTVNDVFIP
ncbi:kelch domain-containing protein [Seiridium cupressi]